VFVPWTYWSHLREQIEDDALQSNGPLLDFNGSGICNIAPVYMTKNGRPISLLMYGSNRRIWTIPNCMDASAKPQHMYLNLLSIAGVEFAYAPATGDDVEDMVVLELKSKLPPKRTIERETPLNTFVPIPWTSNMIRVRDQTIFTRRVVSLYDDIHQPAQVEWATYWPGIITRLSGWPLFGFEIS
jgi:hypothetical protein